MDKPFRTIQEQICTLNSRGVQTDAQTTEILQREGYYSVVNGYKDLFLDIAESKRSGDDVYYKDTNFNDLYNLFTFDRQLRQLLFSYISKAEATFKTQVAYHFMQAHQNKQEPYLDISNYSWEGEKQRETVHDLISALKIAAGRDSKRKPKHKDYLEHYIKRHDEVPIWVLMRYMTLGQTFIFYSYQPESIRNSIARGFAQLYESSNDEKIKISPKRLSKIFDHIKDFRNICAHEERLYCSRVSKGKDVSVVKVISEMKEVLSKDDYEQLRNEFSEFLSSVRNTLKTSIYCEFALAIGLFG